MGRTAPPALLPLWPNSDRHLTTSDRLRGDRGAACGTIGRIPRGGMHKTLTIHGFQTILATDAGPREAMTSVPRLAGSTPSMLRDPPGPRRSPPAPPERGTRRRYAPAREPRVVDETGKASSGRRPAKPGIAGPDQRTASLGPGPGRHRCREGALRRAWNGVSSLGARQILDASHRSGNPWHDG